MNILKSTSKYQLYLQTLTKYNLLITLNLDIITGKYIKYNKIVYNFYTLFIYQQTLTKKNLEVNLSFNIIAHFGVYKNLNTKYENIYQIVYKLGKLIYIF